jgi:hypothetical protein
MCLFSPISQVLTLWHGGRVNELDKARQRAEQAVICGLPPWCRARASPQDLLAFFELQGELADQALEGARSRVGAGPGVGGAGRLECFRGVGGGTSRATGSTGLG